MGERLAQGPPELLLAPRARPARGARDGRDPRARPSPRLRPRTQVLGVGREPPGGPPNVAALAPDALVRAPRRARRDGRGGLAHSLREPVEDLQGNRLRSGVVDIDDLVRDGGIKWLALAQPSADP